MTSIGDVALGGNHQRDREIAQALLAGANTDLPSFKESDAPTAWWQDTFHLLGKPEEVTVKVLGKLFTDDPKYDGVFGSSNFHSQLHFDSLFRDAGVNQENLGAAGPTLAAILGVAAAIANPLDPLNKLRVLGLTAKGKASKLARATGKAGLAVEDGIHLFKTDDITKSILGLEKQLTTKGVIRPENIGQMKKTLANQKKGLDNTTKLNVVLRELQKGGTTIDDILAAPSLFQRVRQGEQRLAGFSSPLSLDHLSLFGLGRGVLDDVVVASPVPRSVDEALIRGGTAIGKPITDLVVGGASAALNKMGFATQSTVASKEAHKLIKHTVSTWKGSAADLERELESILRRSKLGKEEILEIRDTLETTVSPVVARMVDAAANNLVASSPDALSFKAGKGVVEVDELPGEVSRLTPEQELALTPSNLSDADLNNALMAYRDSKYPAMRLGPGGGEAKLLGDFVVVKAGAQSTSADDLKALDKIYGQKVWREHVTSEGDKFLVQRRLPHATAIGDKQLFTDTHLRNLELVAAQLATRKKVLAGIGNGDILITPSGGVQIINPGVIQEAKSAKDAVVNSKLQLAKLADDNGLASGPVREFHHLKSVRNAKAATKGVKGMQFRVAGATRVPEDSADVLYMGGHDLLSEAVNLAPERDYLRGAVDGRTVEDIALGTGDPRDFERASNIAQERQLIRDQLATGEGPSMRPIEVEIDDLGQVHVIGGRDRLSAALLEGLEIVPILRKNRTGLVLDPDQAGFYAGTTHTLSDSFHGAGSKAWRHGSQATDPVIGSVSGDYKIVSPGGVFQSVTESDLFVDATDELLTAVGGLVTIGPNMTRSQVALRDTLFLNQLIKTYGTPELATAALSDLVVSSSSPQELVSKLQELTGFDLRPSAMLPKTMLVRSNRARKAATQAHVELAQNGVLTPITVESAQHRNALADATGGIVESIAADGNSIRFSGGSRRTIDDLESSTKGYFHQEYQASDIEPFAKVVRETATDAVVQEVREFVEGVHPRLSQAAVPRRVVKITEEHEKFLRENHGVLVNPTKQQLEELGVKEGTLFGERTVVEGRVRFTRPTWTWLATRGGDIVVGTQHEDVRRLAQVVFGEGSVHMQEFGLISAGRVTLSNPLGAYMSKIGRAELNVLQARIKSMAEKLAGMGLSRSATLEVLPPFDLSIWKEMYGTRVSLGEVLDDSFKLKIPDLLEGHVPDLAVDGSAVKVLATEQGNVAFTQTAPRLHNTKLQKIVDDLRGVLDDTSYQEAINGIPTEYIEGYVGRQLTQEAKDALNEAMRKQLSNSQSRLRLKNVEPFFKQRVFSDITTREINEIMLRIGKAGVDNPETFVRDIVRELYPAGKEIDARTARSLYELGRILPDGVAFFEIDPFLAVANRYRGSVSAQIREGVFKGLEEHSVLWTGTVAEMRQIRAGKATQGLEKFDRDIARSSNELAAAQNDLRSLVKESPDVPGARKDELAAQIDTLKEEIGRLEVGRARAQGTFTQNEGAIAGAVDFNSEHIWLAGEDAQRLITDGIIKAEDIAGDAGDALVRVPFKAVEADLDRLGARVALFPPDVAGVVDRYFAVSRKEGFDQFLRHWDHITTIWRSWTLFPIPAYHVRNILSNSFMGWLGGVTNPSVYRESFKMFKVLRQHRKGALTLEEATTALESIEFVNATGQTMTAQDLYGAFVRESGLTGGLHHNEFTRFGDPARASTFQRVVASHGLAKSSSFAGSVLLDNNILRLGISAASGIENFFRMAAFLDTWQKGGSLVDAGLHMKRVFYDYSDLNLFERNVLRRVFPFYSWVRHNTPRMLTTLVTDPVKHFRFSQFINSIEQGALNGKPMPADALPTWAEKFGIVLAMTADGSYLVKSAEGIFPMADAYKVLGGGGIAKMLSDGFTPFVKVPIEQYRNDSWFKDAPIEKFPGQRSPSFTFGALGGTRRSTVEGPLGALNLVINDSVFRAFFRAGKQITDLIDPLFDSRSYTKDKPTMTNAVLGLAIGRAFVIDPDRTRSQIFRNWNIRRGKMQSMRNYYENINDVRAVGDLDNIINMLDLNKPALAQSR